MSQARLRFVLLSLITLLLFTAANITPVDRLTANAASPQKDKDKKKKSKTSRAPEQPGTPVLWEDRGDISKLNLFWGVGGEDRQPNPPFQFDKEDESGTNPKIKVFDAGGVKWNVKFDEEVHGEVAASRIVWACGYMVEESYFVPSGKVAGVTGLTRAKKFIGSDGSFKDGMFEKRPDDITRRRINWSWTNNPFAGTKELSGLQVLTTMLNNWDARPATTTCWGCTMPTARSWIITLWPTGAGRSAR